MARNSITVARAAEICARLLKSETRAAIHRATGAADATILNALRTLRAHGVDVSTPERRSAQSKRMADIFERMKTTGDSNRKISRDLGINLWDVNRARTAYQTSLVKEGGEPAKCGCGKPINHLYGCQHRLRERLLAKGIKSICTMDQNGREEVRLQLLAGDTLQVIADRIGFSRQNVLDHLKSLPREDRTSRTEKLNLMAGQRRADRINGRVTRPKATDPNADITYATIAKLVSHRIDAALRDDIISEAYVQFLFGRIKLNDLRAGVKKVQSRMFNAFANPWGDLSLDTPLSDGGSTWADRLVDEQAMAAFDRIA